jgi:hypothetical protein
VKFGWVPEVDCEMQFATLLPPTKNLTFPAALVVTVSTTETPFLGASETEGALMLVLSVTLVIVIVSVWLSVKDPSETEIMTI